MKIYTVTFSFSTNLGEKLQEYALYKYLKNYGHSVKVVNYQPSFLSKKNNFKGSLNLKNISKHIIFKIIGFIEKRKTQKFIRRNIEITDCCSGVKEIKLLDAPDVWIAGSDQIWNIEMTNGFDDVYILNFDSPAKKIAYAASSGDYVFKKEEVKKIGDILKEYSAISVREHWLKTLLNENKICNITHVMDPIFLLNRQQYKNIAKPSKFNRYILVYEMAYDPLIGKVANWIAKINNLNTIQIKQVVNKHGFNKIIPFVSPDEFIGLVEGAEYVVTNSFHGTAFSIKLEKQFYVVPIREGCSRIQSLLDDLGLQNRVIRGIKDMCTLNEKIEYERVNSILTSLVNDSIEFIEEALKRYE